MTKKKQTRKRKPARPRRAVPGSLLDGLLAARRLIRARRWGEALEKLQGLDRRYPDNPEVLSELCNICYETEDHRRYQRYCRRLVRLMPNDPELLRALGGAYMRNLLPGLALQTLRRYLERFPGRADEAEIRQMVDELEPSLKADLPEPLNTGEDWLDRVALHEEVQVGLESGDLQGARRAAQRLLEPIPDFVPAINNLSQIDFAEGHSDKAIAGAQKVLSIEPDNFQALSNLTRYLHLSGRTEEARQHAERLKQTRSELADVYGKKAEALAYLGDDQGVLEAFREAEQAGALDTANPLLLHLAGVAALRLGDEKEARRYWRQALEANPGFHLTRANLADLDKPVGQRHAPWPFGLGNWIPPRTLVELRNAFRLGGQTVRGKAATRTIERFLAQHPELAPVVPMLLEQGDPEGRQLALGLAATAKTPELLAALKDFALSQHGPDELRMRAGQVVAEAGLLSDQPVRFWAAGEWREVMLTNWAISGEPEGRSPHSREVDKLLEQAIEALKTKRAGEAETLLKRALESEPEAPDLLNNLANAYLQQGRRDETIALVHEIHRKYPDYFFGRIGMAGLYIQQDELEQAEAMLRPLLSRKRMHVTEFYALCRTQIQLRLAKGERDSARSWLKMWSDVAPDHPDLLYWRLQVDRRRGPE